MLEQIGQEVVILVINMVKIALKIDRCKACYGTGYIDTHCSVYRDRPMKECKECDYHERN